MVEFLAAQGRRAVVWFRSDVCLICAKSDLWGRVEAALSIGAMCAARAKERGGWLTLTISSARAQGLKEARLAHNRIFTWLLSAISTSIAASLSGQPPLQYQSRSSGTIYYNSGNVGIGTTNPVHPLQVTGTIGAEEVIVSSTRC